MVQVFRGEVVAFTDEGIPQIRELPSDACTTGLGDFISAEHVRHNASGIPIVASALRCCDVVDECPKVEDGCLDGGIARTLSGHSKNNLDCRSAEGNSVVLYYCRPHCIPSTAVSDSSAGDVAWTDPTNAITSDLVYATASLATTQTSQYLKVTGSCCDIPGDATIYRVEVRIECHADGNDVQDLEVKLVKGGAIVGNNQAAFSNLATTPGVVRVYSYTPAEWGVTLTAADVNAEDFGCAFRVIDNAGASRIARTDNVEIWLHLCDDHPYTPSGCDGCYVATGTGSISPLGEDQARWGGNLELRGGTLALQLCCFFDGPDLAFRLIWTGCDEGCLEVFPQCLDPLAIHFGQFTIPHCCSCLDTSDQGTIEMYVVGNCHAVINAEHIAFTPDGIPVVARERVCDWDQIEGPTCYPSCELEMTITDVVGTGTETDCSCLEGVWDLPATGYAGWSNINVGTCSQPAVVTMTCEVLYDADSRPTGFVRLYLSITCGATNTGADWGDVWWEDLEELDVTFEIDLDDPSAGNCTGNCNYIWIDMLGQWQTNGDDCTGTDCDTCPMTPDDNSPGGFDGDTRSQPCTGATAASCCLGWIEVRVRRP